MHTKITKIRIYSIFWISLALCFLQTKSLLAQTCPIDLVQLKQESSVGGGMLYTQLWHPEGVNGVVATEWFEVFNGFADPCGSSNSVNLFGQQIDYVGLGVNDADIIASQGLASLNSENVQQDGWLIVPPGINSIDLQLGGDPAISESSAILIGADCNTNGLDGFGQNLSTDGNTLTTYAIPATAQTIGCGFRLLRVRFYHNDLDGASDSEVMWDIGNGLEAIPSGALHGVSDAFSDDNINTIGTRINCTLAYQDAMGDYFAVNDDGSIGAAIAFSPNACASATTLEEDIELSITNTPCPVDFICDVAPIALDCVQPDANAMMYAQIWNASAYEGAGNIQEIFTAAFSDVDGNGLPIHTVLPDQEGSSAVNGLGGVDADFGANTNTEADQIIQDGWLAVPPNITCLSFRLGNEGEEQASALFAGLNYATLQFLGSELSTSTPVGYCIDGNTVETFGCGWQWVRVRLYTHDETGTFNTTVQWNIGNGFEAIPASYIHAATDPLDNTVPANVGEISTTQYGLIDDLGNLWQANGNNAPTNLITRDFAKCQDNLRDILILSDCNGNADCEAAYNADPCQILLTEVGCQCDNPNNTFNNVAPIDVAMYFQTLYIESTNDNNFTINNPIGITIVSPPVYDAAAGIATFTYFVTPGVPYSFEVEGAVSGSVIRYAGMCNATDACNCPPKPEICGDGLDNDGNGAVDEADLASNCVLDCATITPVEIQGFLPDVNNSVTTSIWTTNRCCPSTATNNPSPVDEIATSTMPATPFTGSPALPTHINGVPDAITEIFSTLGIVDGTDQAKALGFRATEADQAQVDAWLVVPAGIDCLELKLASPSRLGGAAIYMGQDFANLGFAGECFTIGTQMYNPSQLLTYDLLAGSASNLFPGSCGFRSVRVRLYMYDAEVLIDGVVQWNIGNGFETIPAQFLQSVGLNPDSDDNQPTLTKATAPFCAYTDGDGDLFLANGDFYALDTQLCEAIMDNACLSCAPTLTDCLMDCVEQIAGEEAAPTCLLEVFEVTPKIPTDGTLLTTYWDGNDGNGFMDGAINNGVTDAFDVFENGTCPACLPAHPNAATSTFQSSTLGIIDADIVDTDGDAFAPTLSGNDGGEQIQQDGWLLIPGNIDCLDLTLGGGEQWDASTLYAGSSMATLSLLGEQLDDRGENPSDVFSYTIPDNAPVVDNTCDEPLRALRLRFYHHDNGGLSNTTVLWDIGEGMQNVPAAYLRPALSICDDTPPATPTYIDGAPFLAVRDGNGDWYDYNDPDWPATVPADADFAAAGIMIDRILVNGCDDIAAVCGTALSAMDTKSLCTFCNDPGLAKAITDVEQVAGSSNLYDITFEFTLINQAPGDMQNLVINDDIASIPGFVSVTTSPMVSATTAGATAPTPNNGYTGTGNLLDGMSGSLSLNEQTTVTVVVRFDINTLTQGALNCSQGGVMTADGSIFFDDSDNGTDPVGNNGNAADNDCTPISIANIGLAKDVVNVTAVGNGNYEITLAFTFQNTGNANLENIALVDDLMTQFGASFLSIAGQPNITASDATTDPIENGTYTGGTDNMFDGTSGLLAPGQSVTVEIVVLVDASESTMPLMNQAEVSAMEEGMTNMVMDLSDGGTDPVGTNANELGDTGGTDDFTLIPIPNIDLAKDFVSHVDAASGEIGNVDVTIAYTFQNTGNTDLNNISLIDDLSTQFGSAFVGVVSTPNITGGTATTDPTENANYDGAAMADLFIATDGMLAPGEFVTVNIVIEVNPNAVGAPDPLMNQATVSANGLDFTGNTVTVADDSDAGTDPTLDTDEPTLFPIPLIGLAKTIVDAQPTAGNPNNFDVTYELVFTNIGNVDLENLDLQDDIQAQYGGAFVAVVNPLINITTTDATIPPAVNTNYDGTAAMPNLFDGTSGLLEPNQSVTVQITVEVDPSQAPNPFTNQADVSGDALDNDGTPLLDDNGMQIAVTDLSDGGTDTEGTNIGDPFDTGGEDDPTLFAIPNIAAAKHFEDYAPAASCIIGNVDVTIKYTITNTGTSDLMNLNLEDNLALEFGSAFVGLVSIADIIMSDATTDPIENTNFDGINDINLFDGASGLLASQESIMFTIVVEVDPNAAGAPAILQNQATATAAGADFSGAVIIVSDDTDAGTDPLSTNPNEDGDTGGTNDATVFEIPQIGAAKNVVDIQPAASGNINHADVTFEITIANTGNVDLNTIQLQDDLVAQLGPAYIALLAAPSITASTATLDPTLDAAYFGLAPNTNIFVGNDGILAPGQTITVQITIEVSGVAPATSNPLTNQALVSAIGMGTDDTMVAVMDLSDNGPDPESTNDENKGDDPTPFVVDDFLACPVVEEGCCTYTLQLFDTGFNGWDGAVLMGSLDEGPFAEYKLSPADNNGLGNFASYELSICDGGIIDLMYMNGAFENEHYWQLLDARGNVVEQAGPEPAAGTTQRFKAECPTVSCVDQTQDFVIRITLGIFPEEQSWELYQGIASSTNQGNQVIGINATAYAGLAPGSEFLYPVTLDLCGTYTFVAFDGYNDGWDFGTWELITSNLNYGTEITDLADSQYGNSVVIASTNSPFFPLTDSGFADEERTQFTLPCEASCTDEVVFAEDDCVSSAPVVLPIAAPEVCYPNCEHGTLTDDCLTVQHIVLINGVSSTITDLLVDFVTLEGSVQVYNGQTEMEFDGGTNLFGAGFEGFLPLGCHKYVTKYTYCDGIMVKCTADINVVTEANPVMTCNDNVIISLANPDTQDDNITGSLNDDLYECVIRISPDMVLEMPATECSDPFNDFAFNEYEVIVYDTDGTPLVVTEDVFGLPLDAFGFPIFPGDQTEPAHDLVSSAQLMQTLNYTVRHKFSNNTCWGTLSVEDKAPPIIICNDYELNCTNPNALDENYRDTVTYAATAELPANIAGGTPGLQSNTWIPVNTATCYGLSEIVYGIEVNVNIEHDDYSDLELYLHLPTALDNALGNISPILLEDSGIGAENTYVPSAANNLGAIIGNACNIAKTTNPEDFVTENSANFTPANLGGTWYIQVVDNEETVTDNTPVGGGDVTLATITLTCGFPTPVFAYDCSLQEVNLLDEVVVETNCDQSDWNGAEIHRVWQAIDKYGNGTTCTQVVALKAPMMDQIVKPADVTLDCNDEVPAAFTPDISGVPTFGCYELSETHHSICDISFTYEDAVLPTCGDNFKIIRTWTFVNWCSGVTKTHEQIIKVEDTEGPTVDIADITVSTDANDCTADINLTSEGVSDNCSPIASVTATYIIGATHFGTGQTYVVNITNGGTIADLPLGTSEILITATDVCLNETTSTINVTVIDETIPVAICDDQLHVSLGGDGTARVYAEDIDEGSYDNCGEITLEVRRLDGCLGTTTWDEYVPFECCDVDELVTVELRVTDESGNTNVCWKQILVEDPLAPVITCPEDKTITCDDPLVHNPYGFATADDNCEATITHVDAGTLDQCSAGTLTRTFTASDNSDKSPDATCTQTVTVEHISDFTVQFPADVTINTCPDAIGSTGEPVISDVDCELVAISSEDYLYEITADACYKIERVWTIVNWCVYDNDSANNTALGNPLPLPRTYQDDGDGYFQWVQTIKVLDEEAPVIDCPADQTFCDFTDGCEGEVSLSIEAIDGCTNNDHLEYTFKIDLNNNGVFDIVNNEATNEMTGIFDYGTHLIKWIVEDGCGNTAACSYLFTINDCKNPTPLCINGLTIPAMNSNGCVEIWASDLLDKAWDNCSSDEYVENTVKMRRSGTNDPLTSNLTICCDELGAVLLEIWVEDEAGNADFCETYIILQDGLSNCTDSNTETATVAGTIMTESAASVETVDINIAGSNTYEAVNTTATNGDYVFTNVSLGFDYEISASKDVQPLNGVSTYDLVLMSQHILGINSLDTPYKLIAADVNNDGNITTFDIVQTRQLILYVIADFPSNTSWRFVSGEYIFPNPQNPWTEAFPETINYESLSSDQLNANFIGVKVGDVSGDAVANNVLGMNDRNATSTLLLNIEDANIEAGATTTVDFRASDFNAVNGYQFTLDFDASALNYAGFKAGALNVKNANFGLTFLNEGIITSSWNESVATTIANDAILFSLTFTANETVALSEAIAISNRYTKAEAYQGTVLADVQLAFNTANGTIVAGEGFALYQNTPNPFKAATNISFNLPEASAATLKIYDVSGKILQVVEGEYSKGLNTITVASENLISGVLYYQLDTDTNSATKKMIVL